VNDVPGGLPGGIPEAWIAPFQLPTAGTDSPTEKIVATKCTHPMMGMVHIAGRKYKCGNCGMAFTKNLTPAQKARRRLLRK
jgi:hypothetical protein